MLAIETEGLTKDYLVGFWRPRPVPGARPAEPAGRPGRGVRVPRSQRRRQEHRDQAADAADLPDQRPRPDLRPAGRRPRGEAAARLPPREPVVLRLPHRRGAARLLRPAVRHAGARPAGAHRRGARRGRDRQGAAPAPALVLQGHGAAGRHRPGDPQPARDRVLRRADVGARSARPPRRPPADARPARSRLHGVLQLAHPVGCRDAVQPGGHRRPGPAGRRRPAVGAARVRDQGLGAGRSTACPSRCWRRCGRGPATWWRSTAAATPWNCRPIRPTRCCASWRPPARRCCRSIRYATPSSRSSSSTSPRPPRATPRSL